MQNNPEQTELNQTLLSESEVANTAGVSPDTIKQYVNVGLIRPILKDGQNYYKQQDINDLFTMSVNEKNLGKKKDSRQSLLNKLELSSSSTTTTPKEISKSTTLPEDKDPSSINAKSTLPENNQTPTLDTSSTDTNKHSSETKLELEQTDISVDKSTPEELSLHDLYKELKNQVEFLKDERDWLRERLEKMEQRIERDQMLLLSENQMVRTLINNTSKKRSNFLGLPWFK